MSYTTTVIEIDGELVITIPPEIMEALDLHAGDTVDLTVEGDTLVMRKVESRL